MEHIIILTENQIKEASKEDFSFLGNGDFKQFVGQSEINTTGKLNDDEWGEPKDDDSFADKITSQTYNRYCGAAYKPHTLRENDMNNDRIDDFYNNKELDILGNGDVNDDLCKIPAGVKRNMEILLDSMRNLSSKQQAIVLNKLIEDIDFSSLPYAWLKELRMKINSKNK